MVPDARTPLLELAHTSNLSLATLAAARALLGGVFPGDFTEDDWEHGLGGMHALLWEGSELVGHASLIQRRLLHRGRALRTGYVEAVGVRGDRRRLGYAGRMMGALERIVLGAYEVGALATSDGVEGFYAGRGWRLWEGPLSALTPDGIVPTPEAQGGIRVFPVSAPIDLTAELTCDWRDGDVW